MIDLADYKKQARELSKTHKETAEYRYGNISKSMYITKHEKSVLSRYYKNLCNAEHDVSDSVAEWLLDNYELIKYKADSINIGIQNAANSLPILKNIKMKGIPRIFAFAAYYADTHNGNIKQNEIIEYILEYQNEFALTMSELWTLQTAFEAVLLKNILTICERRNNFLKDKQKFITYAEHYCKSDGTKGFSAYINENNIQLLAFFIEQVQAITTSSDTVYRLDSELHSRGLSAETVLDNARNMESGCAVLFKNLVTSLISLNKFDWGYIFESVSVVDAIFTNSKSSVFAEMDTQSKNIYRKRLAKISRKKKMNETETAHFVADTAEEQNCDVGNVLFENKKDNKVHGFVYSLFLYGGAFVIWLIMMAFMAKHQGSIMMLLFAITSIIPCLQIAESLLNAFACKLIKPKLFCRIDYSTGLPKECSTIVLVPTLLSNTEDIKSLTDRMESNYIANKSDNLKMVLLGDYAQSDSKNCINDEKIKTEACQCIFALNKKYGKHIFYYFQRQRTYNSSENCYMGWERKRGAVLEFNRYITGQGCDGFCYICDGAKELIGTKYIVTLDSDTITPFDSILRLVGTLHHPLNAPVVDNKKNTVVSGYGILQPRMETNIVSAYKTAFSQIMSGDKGTTPYASGAFEEYQDIFGKGNFSGKGIYSPDVFLSVLDGRFADNSILSHDMIEGIYMNSAYVSDIEFSDEIPSNYISYRKRTHRWIRGDWQLLPFLKRYVFNKNGERIKNTADGIAKLKIIQNLRRTLFYPIIGLYILLGIMNLSFLYTGLIFLSVYSFYSLIFELYDKLKIKKSGNIIVKRRNNSVKLALLNMIFALDGAVNNIDAVIRTVYRLKKHKKLLEWQTAQQAEYKASNKISAYFHAMLASVVLGMVLLLFGCIMRHILPCIVGVVYAFAPVIAYMCSFNVSSKKEELDTEQMDIIDFAARGAWYYFRDLCTKEHNFLPPDNYQVTPSKGAAPRTSPTNIGMMLVSCIAAVKLEYANHTTALDMIYNALVSLDKLEKWNGHPYNWYDTKSLCPLEPRFVSSADNGNLACSLLTLREALRQYCAVTNSDELKQKAAKCIDITKKLINDMDFSLLYDNDKSLFSVGFDVQNGKLSEYAYDLFASEARQASFYAIVSGQVPVKHWERLSRETVIHDGKLILKSWSGSMFEYLMPALFMKTYKGTFTDSVYCGIIREQINYTKSLGIPWGVSESGYFSFDESMNYQYKAFGIPVAALRRVKGNEIVISPYACALALSFCKKKSANNLIAMKKLGLCGIFGFYEACEISNGKLYPVMSFMAHHEGMTLLSAANALCDNCITDLFHSSPEVRAGEHLLQEKLPVSCSGAILKQREKTKDICLANEAEEFIYGVHEYPKLTALSDGDYGLVISSCGSNYSHFNDIMVNKWSQDKLNERYGHFIFIKDMDSGNVFCATPAPLYKKSNGFKICFSPFKASFNNTCGGIQTELDICVTGEYNATVFMLNIKNVHNRRKRVFIADHMQAALETMAENKAHPQYSDMFIRTEFDDTKNAFFVKRIPRNLTGTKQCMALVLAKDFDSNIKYMTSNYDFVGRNRDMCDPAFCDANFVYEDSKQTNISKCLSLGCEVELMPNESVKLCYTIIYSKNEEHLYEYASHFTNVENCVEIFSQVYERNKVNLHANNITKKEYELSNRIISALYYPSVYDKNYVRPCEKNVLWKYGISGDLPIISFEAANNYSGLDLMLKLYVFIAKAKVSADLVIISNDDGYHGSNYEEIKRKTELSSARAFLNKKSGIFIIRKEKNSEDTELIKNFAEVRLSGSASKVYALLMNNNKTVKLSSIVNFSRKMNKNKDIPNEIDNNIEFFNGYGGFDIKTHEYKILLSDNVHTPQPWSHIIANEAFGTLLTESGGGFTWYLNSRENKLTQWSNDTVSDPISEAIYIKDESNSKIITAKRITDSGGNYTVRYGMGYAIYTHSENDMDVTETIFVPTKGSVKVSAVNIANNSDVPKKLSLYFYADCRMSSGVSMYEEGNESFYDARNGILFSKNNCIPENGLMFMTSDRVIKRVINSKSEFFGRFSKYNIPRALCVKRNHELISNTDCMVIQTTLEIQPHCSKRSVFLLGAVKEQEQAIGIKRQFVKNNIQKVWEETKSDIASIVQPFEIITEDKSLDALFNNFLLYQAYICRYFAKTSFYQCSGAFGFRDQLQDSLAFMYCDKNQARKHILRAASQQFEQGDVRHWWHENTGYGIRTKISDDMMFLPYVCYEYVRFTNDWQIFDEQVPFAKGQEIRDGQNSDFGRIFASENTKSLYEHCMLAIKRAAKFGKHGLLLIGTGDWNDGFDKVGEQGHGESVWLTFFVGYVINLFKQVCIRYHDTENIGYIGDLYKKLKEGIESNAWDGEWFRRAYYDDGTPLGSTLSDECKIDVIAQAWAAISGMTSNEKVRSALNAVEKLLVDENGKLVKLFTPPFENSVKDPGYIKAYRSGLRENGGQYTHGAIWLIQAYMMTGESDKAYRILKMLNPINHALTKKDADIYKVEPYVVAADIYSAENAYGMGGWSWYTGSAAWLYKIILEYILGIVVSGEEISFSENVPKEILPLRVNYCHKSANIQTQYTIDMIPSKNTTRCIHDMTECDYKNIKLFADGEKHKIILYLKK